MSPWNGKFTLFILGIVFKGCLDGGYEEKTIMPVILSSNRLEQAGEHPQRRFPLLGTGFLRRAKWAGVMVIGLES